MRRLMPGLAAFMVLVNLAGSRAADTRELLIDAWNRRQSSIHSFQFSWTGKRYARADVAVDPIEARSLDKPVDHGLACETQMTLTVDEKRRFRFDVHEKVWAAEKSAYVPKEQIDAFDGPLRRNFFSRGVSTSYPLAFISKHDPPTVLNGINSLAITMVYRPFDMMMINRLVPEKIQLSAEQATIDGHPCIIVEQVEGNYGRRVWADTSRDYVPVRWVSGPDGRRSMQIDISYSKDAKYGWVPTAWNAGLFDGPERIEEGWQTITVKYQLNEAIPDSEFQLKYPVGTWIQDYTTKETYILLKDGKKRPILPGEYNGKNYEELLHSKPRQPSRS